MTGESVLFKRLFEVISTYMVIQQMLLSKVAQAVKKDKQEAQISDFCFFTWFRNLSIGWMVVSINRLNVSNGQIIYIYKQVISCTSLIEFDRLNIGFAERIQHYIWYLTKNYVAHSLTPVFAVILYKHTLMFKMFRDRL